MLCSVVCICSSEQRSTKMNKKKNSHNIKGAFCPIKVYILPQCIDTHSMPFFSYENISFFAQFKK